MGEDFLLLGIEPRFPGCPDSYRITVMTRSVPIPVIYDNNVKSVLYSTGLNFLTKSRKFWEALVARAFLEIIQYQQRSPRSVCKA